MSDRKDKKSKRRRRRDRDDDDEPGISRGSGVNYSKVADRHIDDDRFESHRKAPGANPSSTTTDAAPAEAAAAQPKVSSQMTAVMRLMAGMEERTISEKLADSNRPTWEQYKKDNADKLDISGVDQKRMEAYRKELDEQRDKMLNRGTNHGKDDKKSKKKKKKRSSRRHDDSYSSDSDSYDSSDSDRRSRKRKKHKKRSSKHKKSSRRYDSDSSDSRDDRKKSSKHKKKKDKKRKSGDDDGSSSGDGYRLSAFFENGSDDESR